MAGKRIDIMDLRDLIRLKKQGLSNRKASKILHLGRNTVNTYVRQMELSKLSYSELERLSDPELLDLFPDESEVNSGRYKELSANFPYYRRELKKPGCTLKTLWKEYLERHPEGYRHSQFNHHYSIWLKKSKSSLKLDHKAGEKLYVDFTGKKLSYVDKETGQFIDVNVFVAILPASSYTFVMAVRTQSTVDVVDALNNCLEYMGGVPMAIVPDNMKAAVIKSHKYAPTINPTLRDFAQHYQCVIDPTRPYSPQDKAMVEGAVKLVYQRIFYPLNKHTFFSLSELNKEIRLLLDRYNRYCFSQSDSTREQEFFSLEKNHLLPLPSEAYELRYFKKLTVQKMGHVHLADDKHYYSVPYRFIGKKVTLCYGQSSIEVFCDKERIAFHKRDYRKGKYTTNVDHLSSHHRAYSQWSLEYFQSRAEKIGPSASEYITELIQQKPYPEIGYKQANGIMHLSKDYTAERIEKACQKALEHARKGYHIIENILKNGMDKEQADQSPSTKIPPHQNVRGSGSYS